MINIDFLTLKAFFIENKDYIIGSRLQKIQQPTRRDFILSFRNNGESRKFYININPNIYHLCFINEANAKKRNIIIPQKPPMFCMQLRKYLEGAKVSFAKVIEGERIFELYFDVYDELSEKRILCLTIELMGKHSNIILYDKETSIIIGCAHNVGSEKSRYRELQGGLKYIYPPMVNKVNSWNLSNELKLQFQNLSQEEINNYLAKTSFTPAVKNDRYTLFSELLINSVKQNSVNEMLDNYYADFQEKINIKSEKTKLTEIVNAKLKKTNNSISKISALMNKRDNTEKYKLWADILTSNLYRKSEYKKQIELFDYYNNINITIELDETKTLKENAQRYYKLYTKSKTTKEKSEKILHNLYMEHKYLENILYGISAAKNNEELEDINIELGIKEDKKKKTEKTLVEKINIHGFDVYIGKNNKQNDYIVSKLAKNEDYWFHTRLCAGSHILLKTNGVKPADEILFECCKLAREYSSATQPSKIGVIYTLAKNLRKPPAAPLGYVTYKNEKEILV